MRSIRYAHLRSANAQRHHESISAKTPRRGNALRDAPPDGIIGTLNALVAQPDRASDYESEGRRFESCRAHYEIPANTAFLPLEINVMVGLCLPFYHLSFRNGLAEGACTCDLDVPVLGPVRTHHATVSCGSRY